MAAATENKVLQKFCLFPLEKSRRAVSFSRSPAEDESPLKQRFVAPNLNVISPPAHPPPSRFSDSIIKSAPKSPQHIGLSSVLSLHQNAHPAPEDLISSHRKHAYLSHAESAFERIDQFGRKNQHILPSRRAEPDLVAGVIPSLVEIPRAKYQNTPSHVLSSISPPLSEHSRVSQSLSHPPPIHVFPTSLHAIPQPTSLHAVPQPMSLVNAYFPSAMPIYPPNFNLAIAAQYLSQSAGLVPSAMYNDLYQKYALEKQKHRDIERILRSKDDQENHRS